MRICLISSEHSPWGGIGHSRRRQARLLATRHEVTLVHSEGQAGSGSPRAPGVREIFTKPGSDLVGLSFSCEEHRLSAGVMEAIEDTYGSEGPDLIEACDYRAAALVPLQARQAGHPLLKDTVFCTQLSGASELLWLHDGVPSGPATRLVADLERAQMERSDHVLWRGGDTLDLYRRY